MPEIYFTTEAVASCDTEAPPLKLDRHYLLSQYSPYVP